MDVLRDPARRDVHGFFYLMCGREGETFYLCTDSPGKGEVESWSKRRPNVGRRTSFIYTQEKRHVWVHPESS